MNRRLIRIAFFSFLAISMSWSAHAQSNYPVPRAVGVDAFVRRVLQPHYGKEERNELIVEGFYPIGWSRDGKFAYYLEPPDEACGCYFAELVIQDLRTDKVLWKFKNDPESRVDAQGTPIADDRRNLWRRNQKMFSEKLREHGIVPVRRSLLLSPTFNTAGKRYKASVTTRKAHEEGYGLDMVRYVKVEFSSPGLGTKDLFSAEHKSQSYPPIDIQIAGALKSPFENRAAIILVNVYRGYEGPPHTVNVQVVGADLVRGFRK